MKFRNSKKRAFFGIKKEGGRKLRVSLWLYFYSLLTSYLTAFWIACLQRAIFVCSLLERIVSVKKLLSAGFRFIKRWRGEPGFLRDSAETAAGFYASHVMRPLKSRLNVNSEFLTLLESKFVPTASGIILF